MSAQPHSCQLAGVLQQRYSLPLLPLDVWNILSLELIQTPESLTQQPEVLFVAFQGRKQLCMDVQVSELLRCESLTEFFAELKVEQISEEIVLVLLWDTPPSAQAILGVLTRLAPPIEVAGKKLQAAGMVVGRQLVALGVVPCEGGVSLQGQGTKLALSVPVCLRTLLHWELKPDLIMLKVSCAPLFPPFDSRLLSHLASLAKQAEEIQLVAPVPSIVLRDGKELQSYESEDRFLNDRSSFEVNAEEMKSRKTGWKCACGITNTEGNTCDSCGKRRTLQIEVHERHSSAETCAQCQALKVQLDEGKVCPACGITNRTTARICKACFAAFSTSLTAGEWLCAACKMNNSASRTYCAGCYASKGQEARGSPESRWTCDNCQTVNLKGLSRCKNCLLKPGAVTPVVTWTCRKCHFSNTNEVSICRACSSSKEIAASVTDTARTEGPDYWTCWSCKGLNLPEKSLCRKCGNPHTSEQALFDYSPPPEEFKACLNCQKPVTGRGSFCAACLHSEPKPIWTCSNCSTVNSAGYCSKCFHRPK